MIDAECTVLRMFISSDGRTACRRVLRSPALWRNLRMKRNRPTRLRTQDADLRNTFSRDKAAQRRLRVGRFAVCLTLGAASVAAVLYQIR